ncbi:MAG: hypothetical protein GX129_08785 [Clostridiales bacterium]|jgi:hypothetical protein|nr:hypothetical protein [Clostridiales bacterium]
MIRAEKKTKKRKKLIGKVGKYTLGLLGLLVVIYLVYYYIRFLSFDEYKDYLSSYDYEEGSDFMAIPEVNPKVSGFELVAENDYLKLYTDINTANVAVYDKRNQNIVYTNPLDADEDPIANETNKRYLKSQFIVNYFNKSRAAGVYDSFSMSVERGQVRAEGIDNGIRYIYDVGDHGTTTTGIVPIYFSLEKMEDVQSKLTEDDGTTLRRYYIDSKDFPGLLELNGVARKNKKTIQRIQGFLEEIGFTEEDYYEQMELAGVERVEAVSFIIPLEYRLEEDGLLVSIPTSEIKEYGEAKIYRIQLLRYMGATGQDDKGYMVVPNGSGSIINFNNGKINAADYSQYIYSMDPLADGWTQMEYTERARLGLFGICKEESSLLATVEDGATLATITAGIGGKYSTYNYAYTSFMLRLYDVLSLFGTTGSSADMPIIVDDIYDCNLSVKYTLLTGENSGYSGIANYYRQRLLGEGVLTLKDGNDDIPFYYDIVGGVKETSFILGTQYLSVNPVTTFEEAGHISDDLHAQGITKQVMNYQGWFNGGYYHDVTDKVKIIRKLGGKSGLEELSRKVENNGGTFYGDVSLQKVSYISKRYSGYNETSRYFGAGYYAWFANVNPTNLIKMSTLGYKETGYYLVSPKFLPRYVNGLVKNINKLDISGISLRDLGDVLHSDHRRTNIINREEALDVVMAQFDKLENTEKKLMISGGNEYSLRYASDIINVPLYDNSFSIIDESIPLYQMIIHGSIDYAGGIINLYDDIDRSELTLRLIEYGASPHYIFTKESANEMKYTGLHKYYSTKYDLWKNEAVEIYKEVNEALRRVSGETIINYEILQGGVKKVTYSNGLIFYINHSLEEIDADGLTIAAKSYDIR